jgi:CDP-paratose synthetase
MIIFISGASGYLGSHLVKALAKEHRVFALMRRTSSFKRIEGCSADVIYIDEKASLESAFSRHQPDVIINTVALYGRKGESLSALINANVDFPTQLLVLANKYMCKAFIHTGTSLPDDISPYALTKNTFVKLAQFNTNSSLKFINIALEHFYGPSDDKSKFTSYVINSCIAGKKLALTDGTQKRDFIYIDDVVEAYKILINNINKVHYFETIPLGTGEAPTIRTLVEIIHTNTLSKSVLDFGAVAMRENEIMYSCADTSKLKGLGWNSNVNLENGIRKIMSYYD